MTLTPLYCKVCGQAIRPNRGDSGGRYLRRVACSRLCALKRPRRPASLAAREALLNRLAVAPAAVRDGGVELVRQWKDMRRRALTSIQRGAGAAACSHWNSVMDRVERKRCS